MNINMNIEMDLDKAKENQKENKDVCENEKCKSDSMIDDRTPKMNINHMGDGGNAVDLSHRHLSSNTSEFEEESKEKTVLHVPWASLRSCSH